KRLMPAAVALLIVVTACQACPDFMAGVVAYERGDYATALTEFRPLAQQGDADAQFYLGQMYSKGHGVPQDYAEAVRWFRRAAEQGDAEAQLKLGAMYNKGYSVPQDYVQAYMWVNLAVAQGREDARKARDKLAKKMTPAQMDEARRLAREWKPKQ
ncbi:sel1 repeat family protein, partial [Nitrospiraceae bacterium AH_259_D15_M11_P09]|nr:sel1 repeat family protein [Nitrospiraceae bacterium AH_259_D15_M11_P09]